MNTGGTAGPARRRVGAVVVGASCALLLAACSGGSGPARKPAGRAGAGRTSPPSKTPPPTWAPGITPVEADAGTATNQDGIAPWLAPVGAPAPTAPRSRGCAALHDPGWRAECVRVDTGPAVLTGVVESRSSGGNPAVWQVAVWREQGQQEVRILAAGDPTTPMWAWAALRSADLAGDHHQELVFGFENEGTGGVLDLDVVGGAGGLVGSQIAVYKGAATLSGGRIVTYHPIYREDDPHCCPTGGADRDTVALEGSRWVVVGADPYPLPGAGRPGFPNDFGPPRLR